MRGVLIGVSLGLGIGVSAMAWSASGPAARDPTYRQLELFAEVLARVQAGYVTEIDEEKAMEAAIDGLLSSLDPHSDYLNPAEFSESKDQMSGEYTGLGIEVTMQDGLVTVVSPFDDSPAARAGIRAGDVLSAINGTPIMGQTLSSAVRSLRGEVGTSVSVTFLREGKEPFDVTLTREKVQSRVVSHRVEGGDVGYVRISAFNDKTGDGLQKSLRALRSELGSRMKGVVLDLRNNPGGLVDQAVAVSDAFLDGGEVVSQRGRDGADFGRKDASPGSLIPANVPVVVLINGASASAAEIVAGALQDRKRAILVGTLSFGKGSVQTQIPLGAQRGALRLTTARYYTPSGRSIQGTGIKPDIEIAQVRMTAEEAARLQRRSEASLPNALTNEAGAKREAPHVLAEMPPVGYTGEDYQLERAVQIVRAQAAKGRKG